MKSSDNIDLAFCRDCLSDCQNKATRCSKCGSPRLIQHPELQELSIAHIDCDAFYASVEKRDDPQLRDHPLIIGGGRRGVVSTACYLARMKGVHSAMPMYKALKLCPAAKVRPPDMVKYTRVSRQIRQLMQDVTPLVEPISIDEAFLDLSGTARLHGQYPAKTLSALAKRIEELLGVSVSIGLSHNKFLSKVASDMEKPRGFSIIGKAETLHFLKDKPVSLIFGVGKTFQGKLRRDGITTIGQLQTLDENLLFQRYGQQGRHISKLARGFDSRPVVVNRPTKSISSETTFASDMSDLKTLEQALWPLCENVSKRLKSANLLFSTITLKLKTSAFRTITRSVTLERPDNHAHTLFKEGQALLTPLCDGTEFRLIGIGGSHFKTPQEPQNSLFTEQETDRIIKAEDTLDEIRAKFGNNAISTGRTYSLRKDTKRHTPKKN